MKLIEKEISHSTHPNHKLKLEYTETPFRCDGCREPGIGHKYRCERCDFDLHKTCATARNTVSHSFYKTCEFKLRRVTLLHIKKTCDACRGEVSGLVYHCQKCGINLHLCCFDLPLATNYRERALYLKPKLPGACIWCGVTGGPGWAYQTDCGTYGIHLSCKNKIQLESWQALSLNNADRNRLQTPVLRLKGR